MTEETLLTFPCSFPLKIMGENTDAFEQRALAIVGAHVAKGDVNEVAVRLSASAKYRALSVTVTARSREQLDALYRDLTSDPLVKVVL